MYLGSKRHFLCCTAAIGFMLGSGSVRAQAKHCSSDQAFAFDAKQWGLSLFSGLNVDQVWDCHSHLLGMGHGGTGCSVHESLTQWWHPVEVIRRRSILSAACATETIDVDRTYKDRLLSLLNDFPKGYKSLVFAFDHAYDELGTQRQDWSTFHVPNRYVLALAKQHPERFVAVSSIHPYRADALTELSRVIEQGAVAIKWLPSSMNIDLGDARCVPFYKLLVEKNIPLIVHCGEEKAVPGAQREELGNPLLARIPLGHKVRLIIAHCASLGVALDLDQKTPKNVPAFTLFARLMSDEAYRPYLHADISAVFQRNRRTSVATDLLSRTDWHSRLLHGSDYPLPAVSMLYSVSQLIHQGLIDPIHERYLMILQDSQPLLFDFAIKRVALANGQSFDNSVFETRRVFQNVRSS
jgi:uncharacterized protein